MDPVRDLPAKAGAAVVVNLKKLMPTPCYKNKYPVYFRRWQAGHGRVV